ncbi:MAG: geranylgeranyl reductase family protein [Acidiferrobacteraceae bacterium]
MIEVDVLVVGLGPAGGSAACAAAIAGLNVLAIDRKRAVGEPVQCAEFVPMPMLRHCQGDGVLRQRIKAMKTFLPSRARIISDFPGLMIDRARFDQSIASAAAAAGARLCLGTRLSTVDPGGSRAILLTDLTDSGAPPQEVHYRVLIAADGPRSTVARLLGLTPLPCVQTRQYTIPLLRDYGDTDIWLSDEFPGGYAWLFPKGAKANLGVGVDRRFETDLKTPLERLHRRLVAEGLLGAEILSRTGGDIPVGGMRTPLVLRNILFSGDAAGLAHPITGAGIAAGVISGERAGLAAVEWLCHRNPGAFESFEEDVRDQFEETLARAVERRRWLDGQWRTPKASDDAVMKRGWIAFPEYFSGHLPKAELTAVL